MMFVSTAIKARNPVSLRGKGNRAYAFTVKLNTPDGPKTVTSNGDQPILDSAEVRGFIHAGVRLSCADHAGHSLYTLHPGWLFKSASVTCTQALYALCYGVLW